MSRQTKLRLDYSGGYQKYFKENPAAQRLAAEYARIKSTPGYLANPVVKELQHAQQAADFYWKTGFHGGCGPYDGPPIAWAVVECKAADGSYWAIQEWQRELPDYGVAPTATQAVWELRLSHWTGPLARADRPHRLGMAPVGSPLRDAFATTASRRSASARRQAGTHSTATDATSTSTPSTPGTAPAGGARTAL